MVIPLVLVLLGRPVSPDESLPRDDLLSIKTFVVEALPSERNSIQGWLVNAQAFSSVDLPAINSGPDPVISRSP